MKRFYTVLTSLLLINGISYATLVTHNDYTAGTTITSSQQNSNENAIISAINGNLDNTNIASGGILGTNIADNTISVTNLSTSLQSSITVMGLTNAANTWTANNTFNGVVNLSSSVAILSGINLGGSFGTSGQVLVSTGAGSVPWGVAPQWQNSSTVGGYVLIRSSTVATGTSQILFSGLTNSYSSFELIIDNVQPVSNAVLLEMQIATGSGIISGTNYNDETFRFTNIASGVDGGSGAAVFFLSTSGGTETLGNTGAQIYSSRVMLYDNTTSTVRATWSGSFLASSGRYIGIQGAGQVATNTSFIDQIRFIMSSGAFKSGTITLYGLPKS